MGLKKDWIKDVENVLKNENIQVDFKDHGCFHLLFIAGTKFILNLVSLSHNYCPQALIALQEEYQLNDIQVIHLWEDVWRGKNKQVLSRINSTLGLNKRIHGRSTQVEKVSKVDAGLFLEQYHLQGNVNARYCFGLLYQGELVALATFSNKRKMKQRGEDFSSAELIRFATKEGVTVVGGLSKLIKYYVSLYHPNDLMSYADRDWSLGNSYTSAGFKLVAITPPIFLCVNPAGWKRYLPGRQGDNMNLADAIEVFNTGNLKYILDL